MLIMMDFCGFFQGKSSEFARSPEIPYTMHPLKKSPNLQKSPSPLGPKSQKSLKKGVFGGLAKSLKKNPKKPKKSQTIPKKVRKSVFWDFFGYFLRLCSRPPQKTLFEIFCDFGPGRSGDSCKWQSWRKPRGIYPKGFSGEFAGIC